MTENEKYSAKGTEFKPNKGDVKQQQWLQNIESVMSSSESKFSQKAQSLIKTLSSYDNIPRKKAKFLNFLKNSLRIYDTALGEEIYEAFSSVNKAKTASEPNIATTNKDRTEKSVSEAVNVTTDVVPKDEEVDAKNAKKKSKKHKKVTENDVDSTETSNRPKKKRQQISDSVQSEKPTKKRKKIEIDESANFSEEHDSVTNETTTIKKAKKSHKKKHKAIENGAEAEATPETNPSESTNGSETSQVKPKKKKHKNPDREMTHVADSSNSDSNTHDVTKKKISKSDESTKSDIHESSNIETPNNAAKKKKSKKSKSSSNIDKEIENSVKTDNLSPEKAKKRKIGDDNISEVENIPKKHKKSKRTKNSVEQS